jgi:hypothetical protein
VVIAIGGEATCTITNHNEKASPTGETIPSWVLHHSLTLSGVRPGAADEASATVTFKLYSDSSCAIIVGAAEEVSLINGVVALTYTGVKVTSPGTYYWTALYSGDAYNNGFTTVCGSAVTVIT